MTWWCNGYQPHVLLAYGIRRLMACVHNRTAMTVGEVGRNVGGWLGESSRSRQAWARQDESGGDEAPLPFRAKRDVWLSYLGPKGAGQLETSALALPKRSSKMLASYSSSQLPPFSSSPSSQPQEPIVSFFFPTFVLEFPGHSLPAA